MDEKELGRRIRQLRQAHGWTLEVLAERAEMHPVYVGGVERGVRNPSFRNIKRLADALGIPLSVIFAEDFVTPRS